VLGSVLALVVLPEIAAKDHGQKNPTVLPFDYGTRLLLVEGALLVVVVVVLVIGVVRSRRIGGSSGSSGSAGSSAVRTTG